jgi:hypothetical protein
MRQKGMAAIADAVEIENLFKQLGIFNQKIVFEVADQVVVRRLL